MDEDIVATGQLYKEGSNVKSWRKRNFVLSNTFFAYFDDKTGQLKGKFDITDCTVRKVTPEEAKKKEAAFPFIIKGSSKYLLLCASSERNREIWIKVLTDQIEEFKDPMRRLVFRNEVIVAKGNVMKKAILLNYKALICITNFPRLLVVNPTTMTVKEQITWTIAHPALFDQIDKERFEIKLGSRIFSFRDTEKGATFWRTSFGSLAAVSTFVREIRQPINIGHMIADTLGLRHDDAVEDNPIESSAIVEDDAVEEIGEEQRTEDAPSPSRPVKSQVATRRLLTTVSEPIASGDLYVKLGLRWTRCSFVLNGIYWAYYDMEQQLVGKFDITNTRLREVSWEECKRYEAQFAFELSGPRKVLLVTASSAFNRERWMEILAHQIEEFAPPERRFVYSNEIILGRGVVQKRVGLVSMQTTKVLILVTNFPRLVIIDPVALVVKEQCSWSAEKPAFFQVIDGTKFSLRLPGRTFLFEDTNQKTAFWKKAIKMMSSVPRFKHKDTVEHMIGRNTMAGVLRPHITEEDGEEDLDEEEDFDESQFADKESEDEGLEATENGYTQDGMALVDDVLLARKSNFAILNEAARNMETLLALLMENIEPDETMDAFQDSVPILIGNLDTLASKVVSLENELDSEVVDSVQASAFAAGVDQEVMQSVIEYAVHVLESMKSIENQLAVIEAAAVELPEGPTFEMLIALKQLIETVTVEASSLSEMITEGLGGEVEAVEVEYDDDDGDENNEGDDNEGATIDKVNELGEYSIETSPELQNDIIEAVPTASESESEIIVIGEGHHADEQEIAISTEDLPIDRTEPNPSIVVPPSSNISEPMVVRPSRGYTPRRLSVNSVAYAYIPKPSTITTNRQKPVTDLANVTLKHVEVPVDESDDAADGTIETAPESSTSDPELAAEATGATTSDKAGAAKLSKGRKFQQRRPPGWNAERLRRVQQIEVQARRDGASEQQILNMREQRQEQEEQKMIKELKFSEKRSLFENKSAKPLFPGGYKPPPQSASFSHSKR